MSGDGRKKLSLDRLKELLQYDHETGIFTWRFTRGRAVAGTVAGCVNADGYIAIMIDGYRYQAHRLAWFYVKGEWPNGQINLQNGVRTDSRISNLHDVNYFGQAHNQKLRKKNTSGVCGVSFHKATGKWMAYIHIEGWKKHLGYFESFDDAVAARQAANIKHAYHTNHGLTAEQRAKL